MSALPVAEMDGPSQSFDTKLILCRIILKTSNQERYRYAVPCPAPASASALRGPADAPGHMPHKPTTHELFYGAQLAALSSAVIRQFAPTYQSRLL